MLAQGKGVGLQLSLRKKIVSLSIVPAFCSPWLHCNEQMNMPVCLLVFVLAPLH